VVYYGLLQTTMHFALWAWMGFKAYCAELLFKVLSWLCGRLCCQVLGSKEIFGGRLRPDHEVMHLLL